MRPGNDTERTVRRSRWIKMYAKSENLIQNISRSMRKNNTVLRRTRSPAFRHHILCDREGRVLMPRDKPVCLSSFVKEDRFERAQLRSGQVLRKPQKTRIVRDICDDIGAHQVSDTCSAKVDVSGKFS